MGRIGKFTWSAITLPVFVVALTSAPALARRQQQDQNQDRRQDQNQSQNQNDEASKREAVTFSEFLDQHPDAEKQLKANPYLINDPNFLSTQPDLKAFLAAHPDVKNQLEQSPVDFMRRDNATPGSGADAGRVRGTGAAENNRELGRMDEFLDEHRDVAQQLALNPSLINDQNYLAQHHDLALFLRAHADVRLQLASNPGYFLQRENQPGNGTASTEQPVNGTRAPSTTDTSTDRDREVGEMDQFLDQHGDLKQDLRQRPVLINDAHYLAQHPELALFLNGHPRIRQDFSEHPELFLPAPVEANVPAESAPAPAAPASNIERPKPNLAAANANRDLENRETTRMAQFLDDHPNIRKDLEKNPWLVNQAKYLKHHKELERFLSEYPQIRERLADNPTYFEQKQNAFESTSAGRGDTMRSFQPQFNNIDLELMNRFLEKHKKTAKELQGDPALVTSQHYIDHNKDLRKFFDVHPHILEEFRQSPRNFMDQENQLRAELR